MKKIYFFSLLRRHNVYQPEKFPIAQPRSETVLTQGSLNRSNPLMTCNSGLIRQVESSRGPLKSKFSAPGLMFSREDTLLIFYGNNDN